MYWPVGLLVFMTAAGWITAGAFRANSAFEGHLLHVILFCLWTLSFSLFWRKTMALRPRLMVELGIGALAAGLGESLQIFLPNHVPDWRGLTASLIGVAAAGVILLLCGELLRRPSH